MTTYENLSLINGTIATTSGNYTDVWIFSIVFIFAIVLLLISRLMSDNGNLTGKFLISVLSFLLSVASAWGSLSLAYITATGDSQWINGTNYTYHVYSVVQTINNPWITIMCVLIVIFAFLAALDTGIVIIQGSKPEHVKFSEVDGVRFRR